jgi:hypothetical protein
MTRLFEYLVERSVRAPSLAAAKQGLESPATAQARGAQVEPALNVARGSITSRRRARYERRPRPEHLGSELVTFTDETSRLQPTDEQPHVHEEHNDVRGTIGSINVPMAPLPAETRRPSRPASDKGRHRASVESAPRAMAPISAQLAPSAVAAAYRPTAPSSKDPTRSAEPSRPPAAPRHRLPTARSIASVEPTAAPQQDRSSGDEAGSVRPPRSGPIEQVSAPPSMRPKIEPAIPRPGEIAPARQHSPLREGPPPSALIRPRPPTGQPSVPRVQVNIGRVEVRAVYAPPPSPAWRPSSAPGMSLDDYLKQREKG